MADAPAIVSGRAFSRSQRHGILVGLLAATSSLGIWLASGELDAYPRVVLIVFVLASFAWIFTEIDGTHVALCAAVACALAGAAAQPGTEQLDALGSQLIWLLLAAFVVAAAVSASGLSARIAAAIASRSRSVGQLAYALTACVLASAFVIPSTAARATLMVPVFLTIGERIPNLRITKALALVLPTAILLSSVGSLIGAGGNILAAEILHRMTGVRIGFFGWLAVGLPFALVSSFASTWVILRLFLDRDERRRRLDLDDGAAIAAAAGSGGPAGPIPGPRLSPQERYVAATVAALVLLWIGEPLHGIGGAVVALAGALAVTAPGLGPIRLKEGLKGVEWSLLLFVAASLELGEALVQSGAAEWLVAHLLGAAPGGSVAEPWPVVASIALVSLLAHLFINSRTARSAVLVPPVIMLGWSTGLNPAALTFLATAAAGFCITLTVSAKPVLVFSQLNGGAFRQRDLLRLSAVLLPLHFVVLLAFAFVIWPLLGLPLQETGPPVPPPF